jgi:hypothetical protein
MNEVQDIQGFTTLDVRSSAAWNTMGHFVADSLHLPPPTTMCRP